MIVQGFAVEVEFSVVHSTDECAGATALTYLVRDGTVTITAECDRVGCKANILAAQFRERPGARR